MAQSPEQMAATMVGNLQKKTGKSLNQWLKIVRKSKLAKHRDIVNLLKSEHSVTHGYANLIATKSLEAGQPAASDNDLVEAQYAGAKAHLRPIYDALIKAVSAFGADVEASPKKTYVSLRRNKQFAIIQPSTKTRVDVGINSRDTGVTDRLEASGSFNSMVSHRVRLSKVADVDRQFIKWLKDAYQIA